MPLDQLPEFSRDVEAGDLQAALDTSTLPPSEAGTDDAGGSMTVRASPAGGATLGVSQGGCGAGVTRLAPRELAAPIERTGTPVASRNFEV